MTYDKGICSAVSRGVVKSNETVLISATLHMIHLPSVHVFSETRMAAGKTHKHFTTRLRPRDPADKNLKVKWLVQPKVAGVL